MGRPKHTRRDINHKQLVAECREAGIVVWDLADLGGKRLDTVMFWRGMALPVEIKALGSEMDFTPDELKSIVELERVGIRPLVAVCLEDVLKAFGS